MTASDLISKYLSFFASKGHRVIPSAPLVPENDPTVLFNTAGMQPLVPYLMGETHPLGKRLTSVQKCVRTDDIDEVGDTFHHTFFEMLGNWSLGDYFKKEAISWSFEFLTGHLNLDPARIYVTVFAGDQDAPRDEESVRYWIEAGIPKERIFYLPKKDNWWGPPGAVGPCGPDSEMHYDTGKEPCGKDCRPGCPNNCGKFVEIWNDVFMQYNKKADGTFEPLKQKNVDTGMGVERTAAVLQGKDDDYETELFTPIITSLEIIKTQKYEDDKPGFRIAADHLKASVFLIADGVIPSNTAHGYILRRLIRRSLVKGKMLELELYPLKPVLEAIKNIYQERYPEIKNKFEKINSLIEEEWLKFEQSLKAGGPLLKQKIEKYQKSGEMPGDEAFFLYESYGLPLEIIILEAQKVGEHVDEKVFNQKLREHQEKSRTASAGMFKGGLADQGEETVKLHTATHLLHQSLRIILGTHVGQKGSNITPERLRFDFSHPQKMTPEELQKVEMLVNQKITENLPVSFKVESLEEAKKEGALAFFAEKYGDQVKVYSMGDFSKEVCGGPHAGFTGELKSFKIIKEESAGAGIRRIYAKIG